MTYAAKKNRSAMIWRIENVSEPPPPLTMLVNTDNLDLSYSQMIQETRTLGGFSEEFWGEQLTGVSANGKTPLFYNSNGLTNRNLKDSDGYKHFIGLLNIYKNNGKEYSDTRVGSAKDVTSTRISNFGVVILTYLDKEYEGYFENFNYRLLAEKPFNFEYDLSFKVTRVIGDFIVANSNFVRDVSA